MDPHRRTHALTIEALRTLQDRLSFVHLDLAALAYVRIRKLCTTVQRTF